MFTYSPLQFLDLPVGSMQFVHLHRQPVLGVRQGLLHLLLEQPIERERGDRQSVHHLGA